MAEVFLLGAGFSRAISEHMPLVADLVDPLAEFFESNNRTKEYARLVRRKHTDLEAVLTYLAEEQVWLDEGENTAGHSAFLAATDWLAEYVHNCQRRALSVAPPDWLMTLAAHWHRERVVVITLNYDLLVEAVVERLTRDDVGAEQAGPSYKDVVAADLPAVEHRHRGRAFFSHDFKPSFRLLKLHGSLNWASTRRARAVADQQVWDAGCVGAFFDPRPQQEWSEIREQLRDLRPLIVPPITGKGELLGGDWIRLQWMEAAKALESAGTITILGYSLPMSDIAMRLLLTTTVTSQRVFTVNPSSKFAKRLFKATGISAENTWGDVASFVQEYTES